MRYVYPLLASPLRCVEEGMGIVVYSGITGPGSFPLSGCSAGSLSEHDITSAEKRHQKNNLKLFIERELLFIAAQM
jgi:hypothetical protein